MPRIGVTYEDVARAAVQLVEQDKNPTIEAVRGILKTGSISTLNKYLREWKRLQGLPSKLGHELPESLLTTVKGLHEAMKADAQFEIEALQEKHGAQVQALSEELVAVQQQLGQSQSQQTNLQTEIEVLQQSKSQLEEQRASQQDVNQQQATELRLLGQRLEDKSSALTDLKSHLKQTQINLEHYQETVRQERKQERLSFNEKTSQLEQRLQQSQTALAKSDAELQHGKQHNTALAHELQTLQSEHSKLKDNLNSKTYESQQLQTQNQELQNKINTLNKNLESLQQTSENDKTALHQLTLQTETKKTKIQLLENALEKSDSINTKLHDKIQELQYDNANLSARLQHLNQFETHD